MGSVYLRGTIWWVKYSIHSQVIRESSRSDRKEDARKLLAIREGDKARGKTSILLTGKLHFSELLNDLMIDYQLNNRKSIKHVFYQVDKQLQPFFGSMLVSDITGATIQRYAYIRKAQGVSNSAINGELAAVRRAFNLGIDNGKMEVMPRVKMLKKDSPRTDDYTAEQMEELFKHSPSYLISICLFASMTGWRKSEILRLKKSEVDFERNEIRIQPGQSKNDRVRVMVMTPELRRLIAGQIHPDCEYVFNRHGRRIKSIRTAWDAARKAAKLTDHTFHGFRRTLRRKLDERGVSENVGMAIMGHKTRHVFDNYRVVSRQDLEEAAKKLSDEGKK